MMDCDISGVECLGFITRTLVGLIIVLYFKGKTSEMNVR